MGQTDNVGSEVDADAAEYVPETINCAFVSCKIRVNLHYDSDEP